MLVGRVILTSSDRPRATGTMHAANTTGSAIPDTGGGAGELLTSRDNRHCCKEKDGAHHSWAAPDARLPRRTLPRPHPEDHDGDAIRSGHQMMPPSLHLPLSRKPLRLSNLGEGHPGDNAATVLAVSVPRFSVFVSFDAGFTSSMALASKWLAGQIRLAA